MMWCMFRTNIYLTEAQRQLLDARASAEGMSRAELIRRLLDRGLDNDVDDLRADLAAIAESFGVLSDEPIDLDRADGARAAHLDRIAGR
jgi:Ribbon-helix-helix protein, copG family